MATSATTEIRASGVLTGSGTEDFSSDFDMNTTLNGVVTVTVVFTKGSLTNGIVKFYADDSASPTKQIFSANSDEFTETHTADAIRTYVLPPIGSRYFRVGITGTGTPTSSDCVIEAQYLAAQTPTTTISDGVYKLSS